MESVVVPGVGAVTPLGVGARTLSERWAAGVCGIRDGEGACLDFDPGDFLSVKEARRADRFTQLAIAACRGRSRTRAGVMSCRIPPARGLRARHGDRRDNDARERAGHAA